jgi:hypothetical protein
MGWRSRSRVRWARVPGGRCSARGQWGHDARKPLLATSIIQLIAGTEVIANPEDADSVQTIAILVIVCFLVGIASAWELVGGPSVGLRHEIGALRVNVA